MRTKALHEETQEQIEIAHRENKNLGEEIKDLLDQVN